ncbi:MAG: hypothetical protein RMM17_02875 [Acidobacteriota bacterium]|nr:hypothetical protein [Blastocatellia bacterium]MDW8411611.1 hypothetical protein [Acidobacteriota bacterium]
MRKLALPVFIVFCCLYVPAQSELELKRYFEGKYVRVRIDMPATKDGVDIYPERELQVDYSKYAQRIRNHGVAIQKGESVLVTKVKVNKRNIEFQLGGGGYGVLGDDSGYVSPQPVYKSDRERRLERELKQETDPERRRQLQRELDYLREDREREERYYREQARIETERRRQEIRYRALQAGSRFNIWFEKAVPPQVLTPAALMRLLGRFVEFDELEEDEFEADDEDWPPQPQ